MSVARCLEINARLRAAGITVYEWGGWESRGNGQTSAYEGGIVHHTGTPYGGAFQALVTGRPDLSGPLCNYAGNDDGTVTVIAAHPANHAGASGGYSMGPLPTTTLFNKRVMGLEIVYPGDSPMRDAQYWTAITWARIVTDVCGYGDIERARAHAETSITGKWDPGYAPGQTIGMPGFRHDAVIGPPAPPPPPPPEEEFFAMQDGALFYAKGDQAPNVYLIKVEFAATPSVTRRAVGAAEYAAASQAGGEKTAVMPQALFDAIPKITGSP